MCNKVYAMEATKQPSIAYFVSTASQARSAVYSKRKALRCLHLACLPFAIDKYVVFGARPTPKDEVMRGEMPNDRSFANL